MDLSFRTECLNTIMDFPDKQDCIEIYYLSFNNKLLKIMCEYAEIENIKLSNGKTIKEVNEEVRKEVERIYLGRFSKYNKISQLIHTQSIAN